MLTYENEKDKYWEGYIVKANMLSILQLLTCAILVSTLKALVYHFDIRWPLLPKPLYSYWYGNCSLFLNSAVISLSNVQSQSLKAKNSLMSKKTSSDKIRPSGAKNNVILSAPVVLNQSNQRFRRKNIKMEGNYNYQVHQIPIVPVSASSSSSLSYFV